MCLGSSRFCSRICPTCSSMALINMVVPNEHYYYFGCKKLWEILDVLVLSFN